MVFNISYAFFAMPFGKLADRIGRIKSLSIAFAFFSAAFIGFSLVKEIWLAVVLLILYGIATAGTDTIQRIIASEIVPKEKMTGSLGTYQGITGIILLPASVIAGSLWSFFGTKAAFGFSAITSIFAIALLYKVKQKE